MSLRAKLLSGIFSILPLKTMFTHPARLKRAIDRQRTRPRPRPGRALQRQAIVSKYGTVQYPLFRLVPRGLVPHGGVPRADLLYIHGGAHALEINGLHWRFIGKLIAQGFAVWVPIFPLVPDADGDAIRKAVWESYVKATEHANGKPIQLIADSAGAGLALDLALGACVEKQIPPGCMVLISPWLDLSLSAAGLDLAAEHDPVLDLPGLRWAAAAFAGERSLADPVVSPLNADLSSMPPALVLTGSRDLLNSDAKRLKAKVASSHQHFRLIEEPGMLHNWPLLPIPEAALAFDQIVRFVDQANQATPAPYPMPRGLRLTMTSA